MKTAVLFVFCLSLTQAVDDLNSVPADLNWRSFIQQLVDTFGRQAFPERTQFAVIVLLTPEQSNREGYPVTNPSGVQYFRVQENGVFAVDELSATDYIDSACPSTSETYNFQVARPSEEHVHSEIQLINNLNNLWNRYTNYLTMNGGSASIRALLLYSWIMPCQRCTNVIIRALSREPYTAVRRVVVYSSRGTQTSAHTVMGDINENIDRLWSAGIEVFQVSCTHPNRRLFRIERESPSAVCAGWQSLQKCLREEALTFNTDCSASRDNRIMYTVFINKLIEENFHSDLNTFLFKAKSWMNIKLGNGFACVRRSEMISRAFNAIQDCSRRSNTFIGKPLNPFSEADSEPYTFEANSLKSDSSTEVPCSHGRTGLLCSNLNRNYFTVGNTYATCDYYGKYYRWASIEKLSETYDYCCKNECVHNECHTGYQVEPCGEEGSYTKNNKHCDVSHPCGRHSQKYSWCYTDITTKDYDYC